MAMWKEFKTFAVKGNVVDLAIGLVIGGAFTKIVNSLVNDIIMPPIGALLGNFDLTDLYILLRQGKAAAAPYATLAAAKEAGAVTLNVGVLINAILNFIIIAIALFFVIKGINKLKGEKPAPAAKPTTKACPYCFSEIPIKATRCPNCTSQLSK